MINKSDTLNLQSLFLTLFLFISVSTIAQQTNSASIKRVGTVDPKSIQADFEPELYKVEAPSPGGDSYKSFVLQQKIKQAQRVRDNQASYKSITLGQEPMPSIIDSFSLMGPYIPPLDTMYPMYGGTPLDNTAAVSNGGILMASVNSKIYAHDLDADTAMFRTSITQNTISFDAFADAAGISTSFPFDPKLIYDPIRDRFIIVYLSGRTPGDSKNIIGFSSTNNPTDEWYVYEVDGNPRDASNWTDYPAISLTEDELFLTINMIIPNVSWQVGFDGSIIWQIPLEDGFNGAPTINAVWHDDIKYDNKYVRNLHPVIGADGPKGPNAYFLSNRNFDLENDSVFLIEVKNSIASGQNDVSVELMITDVPYGMPPNGRQADTDTTDPTSGLQTNDARWLGGVLIDESIQFVGNTINHANGRAAVYHGFIENVSDPSKRTISGNIISHDTIDYGYPNIAWTGTDLCDHQTIIAFNHSSMTQNPGISAMYYRGNGQYSDILQLKKGQNYVNNFNDGGYERWGDYFGLQRVFNKPYEVWLTGFFGLFNNKSSIYAAHLASPDTSLPTIHVSQAAYLSSYYTQPENGQSICNETVGIAVENTVEPSSVYWNGELLNDSVLNWNACESQSLTVLDARNCQVTQTFDAIEIPEGVIYPNPSSHRFTLTFTNIEVGEVEMAIYDLQGKLVFHRTSSALAEGNHLFSFNTSALSSGVYNVLVTRGDIELANEKLMVVH